MREQDKTLVLGFGNPARGDDGVGPALLARLEDAAIEWLETRCDYQLCVEYAMDVGRFAHVLFVDASKDAAPPFTHYPLPEQPAPQSLDTHNLSPEALMFLARTLFNASTRASVLAIRGYHFDPFVESLSPGARENMQQAFIYLTTGTTAAWHPSSVCRTADLGV